jgi:hypothetical protein
MIADNPIVDPRATVEVAFLGSGALNRVGDLFYILNAQVELRADQINASEASFQRPLVCSNARYVAGSLSSTKGSPARNISTMRGQATSSNSRSRAFEVLPHVSQISWGGGPKRSRSWTKSASLVMTIALAARAAAKIAGSSASRSPRSRIGCASIAKSAASQRAIAGDNCASSQRSSAGSLM